MEHDLIDFLIVDDSRDAADSLAELLELMGHTAKVAYSAREAVETVRRIRPTCVMLDISMPDMDGLDLVHALRREHGDDVVLVAVTGHGPEDPRVEAVFELVDHYFTKPVSPEVLRKLLPPKSL